MNKIISVQLSFFCDFHITTSVESVTTLMNGLNELEIVELLPSIIPGQKLNILEGKAIPTTNLSFNSTDGYVQIVCMDNRIDCVVKSDANKSIDLDSVLSKCSALLSVIITQYSILGNRLALNIEALGNEIISNFSNTKLGTTLSNCLNFYSKKAINELSAHLNTRIPIKLSNTEEMLNIITNINSAVNNQNQSKLMIYHIDINTIPENQGLRFKKDNLDQFIEQVKETIHQILSDFEVIDNEENSN